MAMCSSSNIGINGIGVGLDFVSKLVESFKGGFAMDWSEFCSLEEGVLVIDSTCHGG